MALLLLGACGSEPPETLVVEALDEPQFLSIESTSTVTDAHRELRVLRTLTLDPSAKGGFLLRPRDVYVHGVLTHTATDGTQTLLERWSGLERAAQAATQPKLTPFWASALAATDADRVEIGLLLPNGTLYGPNKAPADDEPSIDDTLPFLLLRMPDEVLPLIAAHAAGAWAPGTELKLGVEVDRGAVLPALSGRLDLRRAGGRGWQVHLEVDWRVEGRVAPWLAWRLAHHVTGFVSVRTDGRLGTASLASRTRVLDGDEVLGSSRHRLEIGESVPTVRGDEAADLARLLVLRAQDEHAFQKAVLQKSAAAARDLVLRVRPTADLEHISVFMSDEVKPWAWPSGRASSGAGIEDALYHWRSWEQRLNRLLPVRAGHGEQGGGDAEASDPADAQPVPEDEPWLTGGAAWTRRGVLTAGPEVISNLRTLAHEYSHFACERFEYPNLERVGVDWDAESWVWVDLDGLLALTVLEEAQAEATALCAVLAGFTPAEQRNVIWWYGKQDTRPTDETDFRQRLYSTAYGNSPAVLARYCESEDDLEAVIAKTWAAFPYRTRSFFFPRDKVAPSRLWERAQVLRERGAVDATRVGAFTLLFHLDRSGTADHAANLKLVRALEDDVLLASEEGGLLWVTHWRDEAAAEVFFQRLHGTRGAVSRIVERTVTVRVGPVPRELSWRRALRRDAAPPAGAVSEAGSGSGSDSK